jgi:hypothetical protein
MLDEIISRHMVNIIKLPSFFPGPKILYTKSSSIGEALMRRTTRKTWNCKTANYNNIQHNETHRNITTEITDGRECVQRTDIQWVLNPMMDTFVNSNLPAHATTAKFYPLFWCIYIIFQPSIFHFSWSWKIAHIMHNYIICIAPQRVTFLSQSFRILGPDPGYSQNDHLWEKCIKSNVMCLECTAAVTNLYL